MVIDVDPFSFVLEPQSVLLIPLSLRVCRRNGPRPVEDSALLWPFKSVRPELHLLIPPTLDPKATREGSNHISSCDLPWSRLEVPLFSEITAAWPGSVGGIAISLITRHSVSFTNDIVAAELQVKKQKATPSN